MSLSINVFVGFLLPQSQGGLLLSKDSKLRVQRTQETQLLLLALITIHRRFSRLENLRYLDDFPQIQGKAMPITVGIVYVFFQ